MEVKLNLSSYKRVDMENIFLKDDTKKRLLYLFSDKKSDDCESFKGHIEHISKFISCILDRPLLSDRILNNYSLAGKGQFGNVLKTDITIEELKENYTVVLKDNINYIEDVNEIFINQVRINQEIINNNNPNFPLLISYILCHPMPSISSMTSMTSRIPNKLCQDSIIDIEKYDIEDIDKLLKKNAIKLYGIYEYINGKTLLNYISTLKFSRLSDTEKWNFLKAILIQVFSSLQSLTKSGNYTHYDLHMGNIMISEEHLTNTYILSEELKLTVNDSFRSFIIDQGLSNVEYEGDIFVYENNSLNKPFLHSFDIFKLLSKLYIALATDNHNINSFYCKKLRSMLKMLFNNYENPDDFVMSYIGSNPNGDITLYYNSLVARKIPEKDLDIIYETIVNMSYNDFVQTLLIEDELLDISKEKDINFSQPSLLEQKTERQKRKPIPIIIKGRK